MLDIYEALRCYVRAKTFNFQFSQMVFKLGKFSETIYGWLAYSDIYIEVKTARFYRRL